MDENKLPEKYAHDPERFELLDSGAIYDHQLGRIVDHVGTGPYQITPERSKEFHQMRRAAGLVAQMRALAKSKGIEISDDADMSQLVAAAATGYEALTLHLIETFKASKNLRGMGETYGKIGTAFYDEKTSGEPSVPTNPHTLVVLLMQYIHELKEHPIDGEILE